MTQLPSDQHITYQHQYRKCGKATCSTCRDGQGHGPYWYAYWREGSRLRSAYVGKVDPNTVGSPTVQSKTVESLAAEVEEPPPATVLA